MPATPTDVVATWIVCDLDSANTDLYGKLVVLGADDRILGDKAIHAVDGRAVFCKLVPDADLEGFGEEQRAALDRALGERPPRGAQDKGRVPAA